MNDEKRASTLDRIEGGLISLRKLALDIPEPMLVHRFEMALRQINERRNSSE
jgi:hypothetical protein